MRAAAKNDVCLASHCQLLFTLKFNHEEVHEGKLGSGENALRHVRAARAAETSPTSEGTERTRFSDSADWKSASQGIVQRRDDPSPSRLSNALLLEPVPFEGRRGHGVGGLAVFFAPLSLHHFSERRCSHHRAGLQLVAGTKTDRLAQACEVRPGLSGQSGGSRWIDRTREQQTRNADHGWHIDSDRDGVDSLALGTVEYLGAGDLALGRGFDWLGLL